MQSLFETISSLTPEQQQQIETFFLKNDYVIAKRPDHCACACDLFTPKLGRTDDIYDLEIVCWNCAEYCQGCINVLMVPGFTHCYLCASASRKKR